MEEDKKQASFMYSMKAVFWSFFGLRRKSDFDTDSAKLNPVHIIIAALIGVACFIGLLITIVKVVVSK
ncbi:MULTISPECIES: DUF2970 domain-containing protein [Oxalobacteraceae]|uniref:DUF2970 domain-containing protein n=2 Tax=Rugamonas TaxID=212744 RepID=A0A843SEN1_9BURK|nr:MULTISPECIES: DUF2970 domain-containing protein [Oxalobacteraceae]ELX12673.1 hypothetical protein Jab_1c12880 [Janthinobacterium sp. HH01]MQA20621.1 DUF2970 domain-containing protein [Rugamonas rivuli]MQA37358.1 DUF2970 domain-containing protein [Rugamonas aquatica]OEZ62616.1 hypothetical protein DUGA6_14030 [Duganella sp. HH105]OFA06076.1 hypothetical protein DUGA2_06110 [Duganella sp. HH101]